MKNIIVQCHALNKISLPNLKNKWQKLYKNSNAHFFLSWRWIAPFCSQILNHKLKAHIFEATLNGECIGLAIFVERTQVRHRVLTFKQLLLHKTGQESLDQQWIEYNDFLLHRNHDESIRKAFWETINKQFPYVDEIVIGLSEKQTLHHHLKIISNLTPWYFIESIGYEIHFPKNKLAHDYINSLSKNFRRQINKSSSLLQDAGFHFNTSTDLASAQKILHAIAPLHKTQWAQESGFYNNEFNQYLAGVLETTDDTSVFSASFTHNHKIYAGLIGFIHNQRFYYYLSANKRFNDNKIRIGLSLHFEVIKWCIKHDIQCYDFLAGDYRYKRSFSNASREFGYCHFQRPTLAVRIERTGRALKHYLAAKVSFLQSKDQ